MNGWKLQCFFVSIEHHVRGANLSLDHTDFNYEMNKV